MFSIRLTRNIQRFQYWTRFKSSSSAANVVIGAEGKTNDAETKTDVAVDAPKKASSEFN